MASSAKPLKTNSKTSAPPSSAGSAASGSSFSGNSSSGLSSSTAVTTSGRRDTDSGAPPSTGGTSGTAASGAVSSGSAYSVPSAGSAGAAGPGDITSPHELTAFVENLLEKLESRFDDMSAQLLDRMGQMSSRVDALEASIQDIINGDITATPLSSQPTGASMPQSPNLQPNVVVRRSGSAQGMN